MYIHGDADYLYHTADGLAVQADENALEMAIEAAENGLTGEFFIFHQQPRKRFLWLFPRKSSVLYHYKNGAQVQQITYRSRSAEESFLETEANIYRQIRTGNGEAGKQNYFFYFGHEIPLASGRGYHRTMPGIAVDTESFGNGLQRFLADDAGFDLVTLSTCSNGTPQMAVQLAAFTNVLLASPQNLHLSYISIVPLSLLETRPGIPTAELATEIAEHAYKKLTTTIQTVVSLAVYNLREAEGYLAELNAKTQAHVREQKPNLNRENGDCSLLPFFDEEAHTGGMRIFYRPPRFGAAASNEHSSGWGCKVN